MTSTCGRSSSRARRRRSCSASGGRYEPERAGERARGKRSDAAQKASTRTSRRCGRRAGRRAFDPDVHPRDEQVPGRLARPAVRRADRREADRAAPADQRPARQSARDESGERQRRAARKPRDRARERVVAFAEQEARGQARHWNPASAVDKDIIRPSRERIQDEDLPDYASRVADDAFADQARRPDARALHGASIRGREDDAFRSGRLGRRDASPAESKGWPGAPRSRSRSRRRRSRSLRRPGRQRKGSRTRPTPAGVSPESI